MGATPLREDAMTDIHFDRARGFNTLTSGTATGRAVRFRRRQVSVVVSILVSAVFLLSLFSLSGAPAQAAELVIGTGSTAGVYYRVGKAICSLMNRQAEGSGPTCQAAPTDGSIANLRGVRAGKLNVAVAQSDWQFHAVNGTGPFSAAGADPALRALFSVHGEPFTIVARRDAGIRSFDDLKGKRVNMGNPGSGQRATMEVVMAAKGWTEADFAMAGSLPADQQSLALCHGRIQAMVYTVGHPNPSVGKAIGLCDAVIVEVGGPEIDKLVADNPFYAYTEVPAGIYPGNGGAVTTFGVKATVVASAKMDAETVYRVVQAVFGNLERFRRLHPAFGNLDPGAMVRDGLSAPLHDGAIRYYKEQGLM